MPYNTKKIITDVTGKNPVPAYFNPDTDQYEPLFGQNGSNRVLIWGANDQPLLTQDNPGHVQLTGSIVDHFDLRETAGTIPAGTIKRITSSDDGKSFRLLEENREFIYASLFFRRQEGEMESLGIIFGGLDMIDNHPRIDFDLQGSGNLSAMCFTNKIPLYTNDFAICIEAKTGGDLVCRNLRLYLWKA